MTNYEAALAKYQRNQAKIERKRRVASAWRKANPKQPRAFLLQGVWNSLLQSKHD